MFERIKALELFALEHHQIYNLVLECDKKVSFISKLLNKPFKIDPIIPAITKSKMSSLKL